MRTRIPWLRLALLATVITIATPVPASAKTSPVGPNQHYAGYVNNKHVGAVIYVVCPGPAGGSRTGAPAGGQTVEVERVRAHAKKGSGYTGSGAHEIWAQFNNDSSSVVGFTSYNVAEAIPTSLQLPCDGKGIVTFTTCFDTVPCAANAKDDLVPVTFENIAA